MLENTDYFMYQKDPIYLDALKFLRDNETAVVATSFESQPHASVVYYFVNDDFEIFFITKRNTHKNIHTAFNPKVALTIGFGPERINIQIRGLAELLEGDGKLDAIADIIANYTRKGIKTLPIQQMKELKSQHAVVYKVVPQEMSFMNLDCRRYRRSVSKSYHRFIFEEGRLKQKAVV